MLYRMDWVGKIPWRSNRLPMPVFLGFPCGSAGKESACNVRDLGSIPGLGRSLGEGKGYPRQYSCLENPMDRETWWAIVHGVAKESDTTWRLNHPPPHLDGCSEGVDYVDPAKPSELTEMTDPCLIRGGTSNCVEKCYRSLS